MSKYQEVMNHVKVDDEMKKRILQNVEKQLEVQEQVVTPKPKVVPFRRYAALAATFAVLVIGSYAVMQATGDIKNTATSSPSASYETAMEEAASEAPVMNEAPTDSEAASDEADKPAFGVAAGGPSSAENAESIFEGATEAATISAMNENPPVSRNEVLPIVISVAVAVLLIAAIIMFVIKKKR